MKTLILAAAMAACLTGSARACDDDCQYQMQDMEMQIEDLEDQVQELEARQFEDGDGYTGGGSTSMSNFPSFEEWRQQKGLPDYRPKKKTPYQQMLDNIAGGNPRYFSN